MPVPKLFRLAAYCGLASALLLALNALRRAGVVPTDTFTHAIAPLAESFGLLVLTGLYLLHRERSGRVGLAGYSLSFVGLSGLLGAEFVINLIFPALTKTQTDALLHGPTGRVFAVASVVFLLGAAIFGYTMWRLALLPRAATAAYTLGSVLIALRNSLPSAVFITGLLLAAAGIAALSLALGGRKTQAV
jgi:hypothetical protein